MVALGGVVEDDVEDDLDAGTVERLHHVAELVDRRRADRVRELYAVVRREERDRLVAPVVDAARPAQSMRIELEHGQQFDRGDARGPCRYGIFSISPAYVPRCRCGDARSSGAA